MVFPHREDTLHHSVVEPDRKDTIYTNNTSTPSKLIPHRFFTPLSGQLRQMVSNFHSEQQEKEVPKQDKRTYARTVHFYFRRNYSGKLTSMEE